VLPALWDAEMALHYECDPFPGCIEVSEGEYVCPPAFYYPQHPECDSPYWNIPDVTHWRPMSDPPLDDEQEAKLMALSGGL